MQHTIRPRLVRGAVVTAAAAAVLALASCSSSSGTNTASGNPTPTFDTAPPKTTATTAPTASAPCDAKSLSAALAQAKADAKLGDFACSSTFAVATVEGPGLAQFGEAGYFQAGTGNQWTFVKTVKVDGEALSAAPQGFPAAIYNQWLSAYQRPSRTSTTLCLFYDPATKGCTDKPPAGYEGPGGTSAPSGNV